MIMQLKTIEQIKDEYDYYYSNGDIFFENNIRCISRPMFHMFGKVHEVKKTEIGSIYVIYDIIHDINWYFHKDWLLPVEFINEQEMILC